jgi:dienelactone hydrolase
MARRAACQRSSRGVPPRKPACMCHPEVPVGQPTPDVVTDETRIPLRGGQVMPAMVARPEGGSGPGVVIVHDIFGRSPFYENLARRLAMAGFVAHLPELFFRQGALRERSLELAFARRAQLDETVALEDLCATADTVKREPGERVGVIGFCMGGTLALNLAARRVDLATVCYYGFVAGEAHPSARSAPAPIDEIDRMAGPVLGFWGDQDPGVKVADVAHFADLAAQRGVAFQHTIYPGLGHAFMAQSGLDPKHPAYQMACESWSRTLDFLRLHLA